MGIGGNESVLASAVPARRAPGTCAGRASHPSLALPEHPLIKGGARTAAWPSLNVRELWSYRELLYFLTWRDIKVRYKQTAMGAAWAVLQPFVTMLVFTLFFSIFIGVPSDRIPYPVFVYAGLLPWTFFAGAVNNSSGSLVGSSALITKVYFPRMIIPAAAVGAGLVDLAVAAVILVGLVFVYGLSPTWSLLMLLPLVLLTTVLAMGVGLLISALTVRYRDVRHALPFVLQIWMFASPIIYPQSVVPEKWRWVLTLNPLTGVIEGFRSALVGREFDWPALGLAAGISFALLIAGALVFRRLERVFADLI
ncbi:MAG TPA: ABC transporter permease [Pyrinomonadaceae bacterium]|nr:ABC transporter permease [Pyrinomonadaceae bacterium]